MRVREVRRSKTWRAEASPAALCVECQTIDLFQILISQGPVRCIHIRFELLRLGSARDYTRDRAPRQQPTEGEFKQRPPALFTESFQLFHQRPVRIGRVPLRQTLDAREPRSWRGLCPALVFAGEQSAREREVGQHSNAIRLRGGKFCGFDLTLYQAVLVLGRDERLQTAIAGAPLAFQPLPGGE